MTKKLIVKKAKRKGTEGILGDKNSGKSIFAEDAKDDDDWAAAVNEYLKKRNANKD